MSVLAAMNDRDKPDQNRRRRGKNLALLGVLVALFVLLYAVTIVRLGMQP